MSDTSLEQGREFGRRHQGGFGSFGGPQAPSADTLDLPAQFFTDINWMHHSLMEDTFLAEHDFFWDELIAKDRQTDVCPFWVSTYCMVLALGYDGEIANFERGPQAYPSPPRDPVKSGKLYAAAQRLLDLGDWRGRPQMRVIHAILLFSQFQQLCTTVSGQATRALSWLASGIRIAQIMGLHTLGTSAEQMPIDDAAWPAGKNSMKREVALKGWWNLFFLDSMLSSVRSRFNVSAPFRSLQSRRV